DESERAMKRQTYQTPTSLWSGKSKACKMRAGYLLPVVDYLGNCEAGANLAASASIPNAQLDQFIHALMWKVVPVIILCGGGAILLRELLQWLERAAVRTARS